jgi:hypothetical protein
MLTICELKHDSRAIKNPFQSIKWWKLAIFWSSRRKTHGRNKIRWRSTPPCKSSKIESIGMTHWIEFTKLTMIVGAGATIEGRRKNQD